MKFLISLLLAGANCLTTAFNIEDVAVFLPLLRNVQPRACPPNEMWHPCTANCSDCVRRRSCVLEECVSGCDCLPRYFRLKTDGPCVPVAKCPRPECGDNEVFRECGPVGERCGTLRSRLISCDHRCYCKQGHLRNAEGACVPEADCPTRTTCSHNEEWSESGTVDEFCLHEDGEEVIGNQTREVPGCYCKEGHKRNAYGSCVKISSCPTKCFGVAVFRKCVPKCDATCRSEATCEEDDNCYPGCFCPDGHVMNEFNSCIPKEQCSADIPDVKIVRGSGIMVEESGDSETTPSVEGTTPGYTEPSDMDGAFEDGAERHSEDVGQTESDAQTKSYAQTKSDGQTKSDTQTDATDTTGQEDFANENT